MLRKGWQSKRKLTRDEYAKKCGVSKMAISKAVRDGRVIEDDAGHVDTADPVNRAYLQADHSTTRRAKKAGRKKPREKREADPKASRAAESKKRAKFWEEKTRAEIRLKEEQANYHVQRRAKDLDLLLERAMVERVLAALGAEVKLRILGLPRQVAAELFALAQTKGATPMALEGRLLELLSDALVHCKEKAREASSGTLNI